MRVSLALSPRQPAAQAAHTRQSVLTAIITMVPMLAALSNQTSKTLAEVGLLLILFAGIWFVAAEIPRLGASKARRIVAGCALAVAGLLLIIATYGGQFG